MTNRRQQSAARRDTRSVHSEPQVGKHHSSKDTRRWCRGIVGREHQPKCVQHVDAFPCPEWRDYTCTVCGKVLARYWPFIRWHQDGTLVEPLPPKPSWVDC